MVRLFINVILVAELLLPLTVNCLRYRFYQQYVLCGYYTIIHDLIYIVLNRGHYILHNFRSFLEEEQNGFIRTVEKHDSESSSFTLVVTNLLCIHLLVCQWLVSAKISVIDK